MAKDTTSRFVSPQAWERIEHWSRRKPVYALMGEFSAGKSTLINFLLRTQTVPTQVTATQLPPVWFSWGNRPAYVKRHDGATEEITLDQLENVGVNDAQFVRIFLEADILEAVDLIDTPGISDPKISTDVWQRAVGQANGVLWCTHATQAWRETERATWVSLPERLQNNSLLLITRADTLGAKDRQKVLRRVNREAGHLFNRSILFSARDAILARDKTGDAELWSRSGGGKVIDSFLEITEQVMENRADQLARYQIDKSLSDPDISVEKVQPLRPQRLVEDQELEQQTADTAPLKLVNPVSEASERPSGDETVITSFPVRPARVERRSDDSERPRIDSEEAERLRAEMAPSEEREAESDDELRNFFRDTASDPLELSTLDNSTLDVDEFDLLDDADVDEDKSDDLLTAETDQSDNILTSLNSTLENTPENPERESAEQNTPENRSIEVSVSSITALMAEQSDASDEEYEPEPDSNSLIEQATEVEDTPDLGELLNLPAQLPLSAVAMWEEVSQGEDLPDDPEALKSVFKAFLTEFDKIAIERSAHQAKTAPRAIPKSSENSGAEWHVL